MEYIKNINKILNQIEYRHSCIYNFCLKAYQVEKRENGKDYITHPINMLVKLIDLYNIKDINNNENLLYKLNNHQINLDILIDVILLHDVIEDTSYTLNDIINLYNTLIDNKKITYMKKEDLSILSKSLNYITHIKKEDYFAYVNKLLEDKLASIVKMLDLSDNLNLIGLNSFSNKNYERSKKYIECFKIIEDKWQILQEAHTIRNQDIEYIY